MSSLVEKFRNKKVFILYLVGVLLLSTSVSFAYFTSKTNSSGEGSVAVATTVDLFVEGLQAEGIIEFNNTDMYPGHIGIASIKLTGKGQDVPALYNLVFNGTNTFTTPLNYTVYKTTTQIDVSYSCNVKQERIGVNTIYYEECIGNNIDQLGEIVSSGTIHNGEGKTNLKENEILLTSPEGEEVYYYVVIEYPNLDENQNDDLGSSISGNITVEKLDYQYPEISMVGTTVSGDNGWVKSVSINTTITTQTGEYEALYCTTTSNSCTPNTNANISNNSFSVSLSNNSSGQKVCVRVTDEYNQVKEGCSETYKVDGQAPTSGTTIASATTGSNNWYQALSINATGTDSHSGVSSIRYCTTTSSTCTPSTNVNGSSTTVTLSSNASAQRVCAQAVDEAGNTSTTTCSSAYSVDTTNPTVSTSVTSQTAGSNGWYRALTVRGTGSDAHSGVASIRYCTTTSSTCTPSTNVSGATSNVTLSSNGSAQRVCYQAIDNSGRTSSTSCSSAYSIDSVVPTVSITRTSSTQNSISVTVSGSDSHSGIYQYKFSSNNGSSYTTVSSTSSSYTYTFNNLNAGTTYNIAVQVVDRAGNTSSAVTRSVATEQSSRTMQTIIAGYNKGNRGSFSSVYTATTTNTVFTTTDWKGTSYYFAGAPTDNWVQFGGFYWRIVRVNGDGSVRLIYNGTSTTTTGTGTMINNGTTQAFNSSYNRSEYVGLKYTTGLQHGQTTDSPILDTLQSWYTSSGLSVTQYSQYIDTSVGFCSDRNMASGYSWSSTPSSTIRYAAYGRLNTNKSPSLACTSTDIIAEPVGLMTADEVAYAGGANGSTNESYYLYTHQYYWTMSPYYFSSTGTARMFVVYPTGTIDNYDVDNPLNVRPVINLKATTRFKGSGTTSDPYIVVS